MIRILQTALESRFYYVATPVLTSFVYREAELTNNSQEDLLAGPVTVYLDGRFVGRGEIGTVARGQKFVVGFGADPQLRIKRELADKGDKVQGGNRELNFNYRLVIENYKTEAVTVRVMDRLPHSDKSNEVRITMGEMSTELSKDAQYLRVDRPKGILRWDVPVPASSSGEKARTLDLQIHGGVRPHALPGHPQRHARRAAAKGIRGAPAAAQPSLSAGHAGVGHVSKRAPRLDPYPCVMRIVGAGRVPAPATHLCNRPVL